MRLPGRSPSPGSASVVLELREGWREFASRRWLWSIVLQFAGITAVVSAMVSVLGPVVADRSLGGPRSWGFILAGYAVGSVIGGVAMIRFRPSRMLLAATIGVLVMPLLIFALAVPLAVPLIIATALIIGAGGELFSVSWVTTMQQEIPPAALSRVSSYDALGSFALAPVGTAVAGPLLTAFGPAAVLDAGGALIVLLTVIVLMVPEVRHLRRRPVPGPEP
jgi:predicted MFS family arabinose efflux permease